jgi:hypothetical protein
MATILKKVRQQAVVSFVGTGTDVVDLYDLKLANSKVTIAHIWFSFTDAGNISRNGSEVLSVGAGAMDNWDFHQTGGFVLNQNANSNVVINMGSNVGTVIMTLHKSAGYTEPDNQSANIASKW